MNASDERGLRYRLLLDCFRSGQMNERQMQAHMAEDPGLRAFVLESLPGEAAVRERQPAAAPKMGQGTGEAYTSLGDEISLSDILRWAARWWWLVLCGGLLGALCGLILHLASDEQFTVRLDIRIVESPLGSPSLIAEISTNFLRSSLGAAVTIEANQRTGTISLTERKVPPERVEMAQALMRSASIALGGFLDGMVVNEHARMEELFAGQEASPDAYASLRHLRLHRDALRDGLLESAVIRSQSVRPRGFSLVHLLLLGILAGLGVAAAAAYVVDPLRARHA